MARRDKCQRVEKWVGEHKVVSTCLGCIVTAVVAPLIVGLLLVGCNLLVTPLQPFLLRIGEECERLAWPTATPDWQIREDVSNFVRDFWRAEKTAFGTGELDSLETFFCMHGRSEIPLLEQFDPFSQYKADAKDMMASRLCPFALDAVQFARDAPPAASRSLQAFTVERWAEGPCPTDGSSGLEGRHRRFLLERNDSEWCISESSPWRVVPE